MNWEKERLIGQFGRSKKTKGYGSAPSTSSREPLTPPDILQHRVVEDDTLAGISLKYGVTIEALRRLNKLYASDSIHLRDFLKVPVPRVPPVNGAASEAAFWDVEPEDVTLDTTPGAGSESGASSTASSGAGASSSGVSASSSGVGASSSGVGASSSGVGASSSGAGASSSGVGASSSGVGAEGSSASKKTNGVGAGGDSPVLTASDYFSKFDTGMSAIKKKVHKQLDSRSTNGSLEERLCGRGDDDEDHPFNQRRHRDQGSVGSQEDMHRGMGRHRHNDGHRSSSSTSLSSEGGTGRTATKPNLPEAVIVPSKMQQKMAQLDEDMFQL